MSDIFDLFGPPDSYRAGFWHCGTTGGVHCLGGIFSTPEEAQEALRAQVGQPLVFLPSGLDGDTVASETDKKRLEVAVVTYVSEFRVHSLAILER